MLLQPLSINEQSTRPGQRGFTLVEVLVSMAVLAIGLLSIAALIAGTMQAGTRARYMSMASILASEKLDSLNKFPSGDTGGSYQTAQSANPTDQNLYPGGSLSTSTTCATGDQYCDQVIVSEASGADYETQTEYSSGNPETITIVHTNTGCIGTPTACGVPQPTGGGTTFTRRWLITGSPTITAAGGGTATATGSRRITVLVMLNGQAFNTPVTFQMSMVRP
jgi:type IV pilus modification protein PilV